jgi:membrane fusion protein (multidrug efflux system)
MNVTAQSPAYPDSSFNGTVTAISSRVDPDTRTLTIRAQIPNPDRLLKPGMLLTVDLVKDRSQSLIIPEEAVILEKNKKFALVVTVENTVEKKEGFPTWKVITKKPSRNWKSSSTKIGPPMWG